MRRIAAGAAVVALALASCGSPDDAPSADPGAIGGEVTVFAAASLRATFTELGDRFEQAHPGTSVNFTFAGSSDLAIQLSNGAPGDVFASADQATMNRVRDAGVIDGEPVTFASNILTIVTPPGNPANIRSFSDLASTDAPVVVCAPQVPCGAAATRIEAETGVDLNPASEESSVTDVLGKVTSGQAEAGLVYVTDAADAGADVDTVGFPDAESAVNDYPIAVLNDSASATTARAFLDSVTGEDGRTVLSEAGFRVP